MPDPIQTSSSIPLPAYQSLKGAHDPLPVSSPKSRDVSADARATEDGVDKAEDFMDHLDRTSITVVEKAKPGHLADPVDLITQGSVYGQPGVSQPL